MPFKSRSQLRKFGALVNRGEMSEATFKRWLEETKNVKKLPEKVKKKKKRKRISGESLLEKATTPKSQTPVETHKPVVHKARKRKDKSKDYRGVKEEVKPELTEEEYKAKEAVRLCKMLLNDGVKVYETIPELVQHWLDKGIAELKEFENTCIPARKFKPFETRAILIEDRRSDVELIKDLMASLYKL